MHWPGGVIIGFSSWIWTVTEPNERLMRARARRWGKKPLRKAIKAPWVRDASEKRPIATYRYARAKVDWEFRCRHRE
jgi:hypothetical protein